MTGSKTSRAGRAFSHKNFTPFPYSATAAKLRGIGNHISLHQKEWQGTQPN